MINFFRVDVRMKRLIQSHETPGYVIGIVSHRRESAMTGPSGRVAQP